MKLESAESLWTKVTKTDDLQWRTIKKETVIDFDQIKDYLPSSKLNSEIVSHAQYVQLWNMLSWDVQQRKPELAFQASKQGYNLHTLYEKVSESSY